VSFRFPFFSQRPAAHTEWAGERPALEQFLLLSMLLHVFLVIAFGDAVGVRSEDGARLLGGFTARLQGRSSEPAPANTPLPTSPARDPRAARSERGQTSAPAPLSAPLEVPPAMVQPATAPDRSEAIELPVITPSLDKPITPDLVPLIAKEVVVPTTNFVVPPAAIAPQPARIPPSRPAPAKVEPAPIAPLPALETAKAPVASRELAPDFVAPLAVTPAPPLATINPSRAARELAPAIEIKPEAAVPVALPPAIAPVRAEPAPRARELTPYVEPIAPEIPAALPSPASTAPSATPLPDRAQREFTPYAEPIREASPAATTAPAPTTAPTAERAAAPSSTTQNALPRAVPAAPNAGATNTPGTPQGNAAAKNDDALFGPRLEEGPGKGTLGPAPRIDLDAVRQRARDIGSSESREGTGPRTLFKFPTAPPPVAKRREQEIFDKALKRPDCKDAYADMGLAAVVPLVRDALTEKGCKW
jgi:hypothetical protein